MATVRYVVSDVDAAVGFYVDHLGFAVEMRPGPGFAVVVRDDLRLLLNQPGAGGAGTAGGLPRPGGWNRFQLIVGDVDQMVTRLREAGVSIRGEIVEGRGGRQVLVEDPSGNPIEIFQPFA
ncbi:MAG: VOC family protein [Actinobacteria bacterium]|nr:VOC family protein [Actinomycetota bacterium]